MISRPKRRYNKGPSRRKQESGPGAAAQLTTRTPITPTFGAKSGSSITMTLNQPVSLTGIPAYTNGAVTVTAATRPTSNTVALTFNGALTASIPLTIPFEDPAVRNSLGGYVASGSYTFS